MLEIIVLAAGMGKRMHSAHPKVLQEIAGFPLLSHVLMTANSLEPQTIAVVIGHQAEAIQARYTLNPVIKTPLKYALQSPPQGTADAVKAALPLLEGAADTDFTFILYGDVPFIQTRTLQAMLVQAQSSANTAILLTQHLESPTGYGRIIRNSNQAIVAIIEEKDASESEKKIQEINTGILLVPTPWLKQWIPLIENNNVQQEYYLTDLIGLLAKNGLAVTSMHPTLAWETQGVNDRKQLAELERTYQTYLAEQLLLQGVQLIDPHRIDIRGSLHCGSDVFIDVGCVFEGEVSLGAGVHIEPYCVLKNCQIANNTHIKSFTHIDGATIGQNVQIGPYARIRPTSIIADEAHIGNFVELKNVQIGNASKANHLAYLGDAYIGNQVNIGAGVITANYDGANKHSTIIHNRVFVGSDTHIIAPREIGEGATIAAGTTLTKNVPEQALVKTKAETIITANWSRPTK